MYNMQFVVIKVSQHYTNFKPLSDKVSQYRYPPSETALSVLLSSHAIISYAGRVVGFKDVGQNQMLQKHVCFQKL
jgi:hypothetical protein